MSAAETAQTLAELAKSRAPVDRERLMLALVDLCGTAGAQVGAPQVQALLGSIFLDLIGGAEHDIRLALAVKLAKADWPPKGLVSALAHDEIEIARPVIADSPVLQDADLVRLLVELTADHQVEVAQRPGIGPPVVEAILGGGEPAVMTALAGNDTADIPPEAMARLVEASREVAAMRSPLARHPRLTKDLAERLYVWVGQSLRAAIVSRFRVDAAALDEAIAQAVREAQGRAGGDVAILNQSMTPEQQEMERRLIGKLHMAGQLRPSYLLRALREHRLNLFIAALATLGGYTTGDVRKAINSDSPEMLATACASVGLDRGVFSTLLSLVRDLNDGRPGEDAAAARRVFNTFSGDRVGKASAAFLKAVDGV